MGASCLQFDPADLKYGVWSPAPPMNTPHGYICTCPNGDVYSVGNIHFAPEVLHMDTTNIEVLEPWKSFPVPQELVNCTPCTLVIPDPTRNHILVHFYGGQLSSPSLYAFHPLDGQNQDGGTGTWRCLDSNFLGWNQVVDAALLEGVLFLHGPDLVSAYELDTGKWLDVQWSTRVIDKDFFVDDLYEFEFDSLFCLDDTSKILCLVVYSPIVLESSDDEGGKHNSPSKTSLLYFKFRVERCHYIITLSPLYTRC